MPKNNEISIKNYAAFKADRYFEEIYTNYFERLYAYAKAILEDKELAKDVVSDLFFTLKKDNINLVDIENLDSYLFVSIKNRALKMIKTRNRFSNNDISVIKEESVDFLTPEELLIEKELIELLEKAISGLPAQCQLVFSLFREKGLKNAEIAKELNISVVTVKSQKRKAQLKLKEVIKHYYKRSKQTNSLDKIKRISSYLLILVVDCEIINETLNY